MSINFKTNKTTFELAQKIAKRAYSINKSYNIIDCEMDILATHLNGTPLDLYKLLNFDDFNFVHDVFGIHRHINRETCQLENCFLPRSAKPKPRILAQSKQED